MAIEQLELAVMRDPSAVDEVERRDRRIPQQPSHTAWPNSWNSVTSAEKTKRVNGSAYTTIAATSPKPRIFHSVGPIRPSATRSSSITYGRGIGVATGRLREDHAAARTLERAEAAAGQFRPDRRGYSRDLIVVAHPVL